MIDLEEQLKSALKRESPPAGFAQRVIAATESRASRGVRWRAVAAAMMLTAIIGGWTAHEVAERRAGERARDEVLVALRIAGAKVRYAQAQVQQIGSKGAAQ